jgi:hypothetical protein
MGVPAAPARECRPERLWRTATTEAAPGRRSAATARSPGPRGSDQEDEPRRDARCGDEWRRESVDLGLRGKVALVTGGTRGLGRATALQLAREGCDVGVCGRTVETLGRAIEELQGMGVRAHGIAADVTGPGEVERFVDACAAALGGVDLLVANVGGTTGAVSWMPRPRSGGRPST